MTTTCEPVNKTTTTCPHCQGRGEIGIWVNWSDGMGGSSAQCPVCDGAKEIDFDPVRAYADLKSRLAGFCYKVWLIAGCRVQRIKSTDDRVHFAPSQALCNEVLRDLKELPASIHDGLDIEKK